MPTVDAAPVDEQPRAASTSMGKAVASGGMWLGLAQGVRVALTFVSAIVLARLLSPDDFGVIAMVAPVLALVAMFQDLGLSTATIQARTLDHRQSNAMFWLSLVVGMLSAAIVAIAPLVGWFYGDTRAAWVTAAGGATVLVTALSLPAFGAAEPGNALCLARVDRHLRTAGKLLGRDRAGYRLAELLGAVPRRARRCRGAKRGLFGAPRNFARAGRVCGEDGRWRTSAPMSRASAGLLNFCVRNVDNVLVAHHSGAAVAGLYDRSYRLMMMPLQNINGPLLRLLQPVLSRLRDEPERYRRNFVMATRAVMLGERARRGRCDGVERSPDALAAGHPMGGGRTDLLLARSGRAAAARLQSHRRAVRIVGALARDAHVEGAVRPW